MVGGRRGPWSVKWRVSRACPAPTGRPRTSGCAGPAAARCYGSVHNTIGEALLRPLLSPATTAEQGLDLRQLTFGPTFEWAGVGGQGEQANRAAGDRNGSPRQGDGN